MRFEFVFGVAEAKRWDGAILTIFFGEFCWTITARNATSYWDDGVAQSSLSNEDQWRSLHSAAADSIDSSPNEAAALTAGT